MKKSNYTHPNSILDKELRVYMIAFVAIVTIVIGQAIFLYRSSADFSTNDRFQQEERGVMPTDI